MAAWIPRHRADGGVSVRKIKWRQDGRWQSETFTNARLAAEFRPAVEARATAGRTGLVARGGPSSLTRRRRRPPVAEVATRGELGYFVQQERRVKRGKLKPYT